MHRQKYLQCCKHHFPSRHLCHHRITDHTPQNQQRLAGPSGTIGPNPRSRRDTQQGAQHQVQAASEDLQGDPAASWQTVLLLCHLHNTEVLPVFRGDLLCSNLHPLPLVLTLGTCETSLALSPLHPPSDIYGYCEIPFRFLHNLPPAIFHAPLPNNFDPNRGP